MVDGLVVSKTSLAWSWSAVFQNHFKALLHGDGRAVADVDGIAIGFFLQQQKAAVRQIGDVQKIAHFRAVAPDDERVRLFHHAPDERGNDVTRTVETSIDRRRTHQGNFRSAIFAR